MSAGGVLTLFLNADDQKRAVYALVVYAEQLHDTARRYQRLGYGDFAKAGYEELADVERLMMRIKP